MKPLETSKLRLADVLGPEQRAELSLELLWRVVRATQRSSAVSDICIIGGDTHIRSLAEEAGASWVKDECQGLNHALACAFQRRFGAGAEGVLFIPADLPFLTFRDVDGLVWASNGLRNLVVAPALRDKGTNAFLVPRALPFQPMLGENSFPCHLAQAQAQQFPIAIYVTRGLGFDLDTPEDLAMLMAEQSSLREPIAAVEKLGQGYASQLREQ